MMRACLIGLSIVLSASIAPRAARAGAVVEGPASALLPPGSTGTDLASPPTPAPAAGRPRPAAPAARTDPGPSASRVGFERLGEAIVITVQMAGASAATLTRSGSEVLLSFPRALPTVDTPALLDRARGLLDGLSIGFDTLLLQLAPGAAVLRADAANSIRLTIQPASADTRPGAAAPPDQGDLRLRLLDAQLLAQSGDTAEARRRLQALLPEMPGSPEPLAALAGIDQQQGRWRLALGEYQAALRLDPGNPDIEGAVASINRAQGSRLRTDLEYRQTDGGVGTGRATAWIGGLSGHQLFGDGWRIGFTSDLAQVDASQVQRATGATTRFSGTRGRTELYLQRDSLDGNVFGGSLLSNGETLGASLRAELPDASGRTLLRADYRRPYWEFFQSIVNQGTRDRVSIGRSQQLGRDLSARLEVGLNRYNVQGDADVDRTVSVNGELRLARLAGIAGLSTAYVFDAEYLVRQVTRAAPDGTSFMPLQLLDREVHAATLSYAGALGASTAGGLFSYELSGGYGVDRYGKGGPLLAAVLGYSRGNADLRMRANYVENIGRSRGTSWVYGVTFAWIF